MDLIILLQNLESTWSHQRRATKSDFGPMEWWLSPAATLVLKKCLGWVMYLADLPWCVPNITKTVFSMCSSREWAARCEKLHVALENTVCLIGRRKVCARCVHVWSVWRSSEPAEEQHEPPSSSYTTAPAYSAAAVVSLPPQSTTPLLIRPSNTRKELQRQGMLTVNTNYANWKLHTNQI